MLRKQKPKVEVYTQTDIKLQTSWISKLVQSCLIDELWKGKGFLSIIIMNDEAIRNINHQFLGRDDYTDVISFPYDDGVGDIWGEVYISVDQTKRQALTYRIPFKMELARLAIHGLLHLIGYDDQDDYKEKVMHEKENFYLEKYNRMIL